MSRADYIAALNAAIAKGEAAEFRIMFPTQESFEMVAPVEIPVEEPQEQNDFSRKRKRS